MPEHAAILVAHGRLQGFLPRAGRGGPVELRFDGRPMLKDPVEAAGIPHTEVAAVRVGSAYGSLQDRAQPGTCVEVLPVLVQDAGDPPRFVLDVHLGRLAADLRLIGIDAAYDREADDDSLVRIAAAQNRTLLTRDTGLLKRTAVRRGAFVHATAPPAQLDEVRARFGLARHARLFARCRHCNAPVAAVDADEVSGRVPPGVRASTSTFSRCAGCARVYWRGSHEAPLRERLRAAGFML